MKIIRFPDRPPPAAQPIKRFDVPALGPHHAPPLATPPTASNDIAAQAVRIAKNPPGINPRQQRF
jgi:hypothetical protein